ncbi:MAG: oligosaccharide flippase family protein, partial [Symploca sp. SIO2C1]|nr:oligosaccharide flippase family protein [Symploca sp. SIO2C1]
MSSIKKQAIVGTIWTLVGHGGSQTLRLVSNLILTRLLVPELFGLMALVNTFIIGLNLFSDIGVRASIIQNKRGEDPVFLNTAWTLQVIRGFGLWFCSLIIAWPIANFYNDQRLLLLVPIVGLTTVIDGFNSTGIALLNRKIQIGKLTRFEFGVQSFGIFVMIVWAYFQRTVWALVAGNLLSKLLKMWWSHRLVPELSNRFTWEQESLKELISFGRWIFISTAMTFLASQADRLMLGKLFPLEVLGFYTVAFTFAELPRNIIKKISSSVMFPIMSKYADIPRQQLRAKILQKRWLLLVGLAIVVTVLVSFGDLIIKLLYDARYDDAAWMLPILSLGIWPIIISMTINKALFAIGKSIYIAIGNAFKLTYMIIGVPLAFSRWGVLGAIVVIAFNDIPSYIVFNYGLWREGLTGIGQDIQATAL